MGWFSSSEPQRSTARRVNVTDSNKTFMREHVKGGFTDDAKGGRKWVDNKKASGGPKGRK